MNDTSPSQNNNEAELEQLVIQNLESLQPGLKFVAQQRVIPVGRIDIQAESRRGETIIIELKWGIADESALGQITRYLGWFSENEERSLRGILVAAGFTDGVRYAARNMSILQLVEYDLDVRFRTVSGSTPAFFPRKG